MKQPNPYDYLRVDRPGVDEPVDATSAWTITESREETVTITNAVLPDGFWVYGYNVYLANGKSSVRQPSAGRGCFRSQRDAKLHAVGFMKNNLSFFIPETQNAIRRAESSLLQAQLFG